MSAISKSGCASSRAALPPISRACGQAVAACPVTIPDEFNYGLTKRKAILEPFEGAYPVTPAIDWGTAQSAATA